MAIRGTDITDSSNKTRGIFTLNGLLGGIIATVLLLAILAFLVMQAIAVQKANATNYYEIENPTSIKAISADNANNWVNR